jgi:hypothetical protein
MNAVANDDAVLDRVESFARNAPAPRRLKIAWKTDAAQPVAIRITPAPESLVAACLANVPDGTPEYKYYI